VLVGHGRPDLPDGEGLAGQFVQDIPDGVDSSCWPGCLLAGRRADGCGECLADHAAMNVVAGGDLPDGHAAGGVIADGAEQPGQTILRPEPQWAGISETGPTYRRRDTLNDKKTPKINNWIHNSPITGFKTHLQNHLPELRQKITGRAVPNPTRSRCRRTPATRNPNPEKPPRSPPATHPPQPRSR